MPPADKIMQDPFLTRANLLLFGRPRTRKTTWALKAAELGYNVIHICGDRGGAQVISQIPSQYRSHIQLINAENEVDKPVIVHFLAAMFRRAVSHTWWWDEVAKKPYITPQQLVADHPVYEINLNKLTTNDIVCIDSWSSVAWGLHWQYALENDLKFEEFATMKNKWEDYRYSGHMGSYFLSQISGLKSHRILICHEGMYEKRDAKDTDKVLWSRVQVLSTSGNHAATIGVNFDMLRFQYQGANLVINSRSDEESDGGARSIPPNIYQWSDLPFKKVCQYLGARQVVEPKPCEAFAYYERADQCPGWAQKVSLSTKKTLTVGEKPNGDSLPPRSVEPPVQSVHVGQVGQPAQRPNPTGVLGISAALARKK